MQVKPEEMKGIMTDFDEPGHLAPTGLHLGGAKYMVIQGEPNAVIRGKKVLPLFLSLVPPSLPSTVIGLTFNLTVYKCLQGSGGVTIKKTAQALLFGVYEEPVTPGQCNLVVERLGDYLSEQGL